MIAIGLSMDACAVSICKGLAVKRVDFKSLMTVGLWFGGFQAGMPLLGYYCSFFKNHITSMDHWFAFGLLALIGFNMLREALTKDKDDQTGNAGSLGFRPMLTMAVATSIDALAVGITFALMDVNLPVAVSIIGVTTFVFSDIGLAVGQVFGKRYKKKAEIAGGIVLILLGVKILLEHLGILNLG